jgi:hypothetical protein
VGREDPKPEPLRLPAGREALLTLLSPCQQARQQSNVGLLIALTQRQILPRWPYDVGQAAARHLDDGHATERSKACIRAASDDILGQHDPEPRPDPATAG